MAIQLRHQTQRTNLPSAASHGVGLPVSDGGLGAASRALGQVAGAAGQIGTRLARQEKALTDSEITEAVDQWRLKRSDLTNQMADAQEQNDYGTLNKLYEEYENLNPQNKGWDLSTYQTDRDKRELKAEDWQDYHNNLQKEYLDEQVGVRREKVAMEFAQKAKSVDRGMDDIVKGFHQSEKPYSPSNMDQLFAYVDSPAVATILNGMPEEQAEQAKGALIAEHTDNYFKAGVDYFRTANDTVGAEEFAKRGREHLKAESSLSGEARGVLEQRLNDLVGIAHKNFDASATVRRLKNDIFYGEDPFMTAIEVKQLAELHSDNKQLQQLLQDHNVFLEYSRPERKQLLFSKLSPEITYAELTSLVDEVDFQKELSEPGREELLGTLARDAASYRAATAKDQHLQALSVLNPRLHKAVRANPSDPKLHAQAVEQLDPNGAMNLEKTWHPVNDIAVAQYNSGNLDTSVRGILGQMERDLGKNKTYELVFNNINSADDDYRHAAAGLILHNLYGMEVSEAFLAMLNDNTQEGTRARQRAFGDGDSAGFLRELREDPDMRGTIPDALEDQIGYMGTALGNYAALLAYNEFRDKPDLDSEGVLKRINDSIGAKLDITPTGWSGKGSKFYAPRDFVDTDELSKGNYMKVSNSGFLGFIQGRLLAGTYVTPSEFGRRVGLETSRAILAEDPDIGITETWRGMSKDDLDAIKAEGGMQAQEIEWLETHFSEEQQIQDMLNQGLLYPELTLENGKLIGRFRYKQREPGIPDSLRYVRNLRDVKNSEEYRNAPPITFDYNEMMKKALDISYEPREILRPGAEKAVKGAVKGARDTIIQQSINMLPFRQ